MMRKTSGTLTRAEVAKAFDKDKSWVIREEKAGRLKPVGTGKRNARLYDEQDIRKLTGGGPVERLPKAQAYVPAVASSVASVSAQMAAKVITRLAAGATRLEVLVEFELYPETVEELDAARIRLGGGLSLTGEHLDAVDSLLGRRPEPGDPDAFIELMKIVAYNLVCMGCRRGKASYCDACRKRYARDAGASVLPSRTNAAVGGEGRGQYPGAGRAARPHVSPPRRPPPCDGGSGAATPASGAVTTADTAEHASSRVRGGPSSTVTDHDPTEGMRPDKAGSTTSGAAVGPFDPMHVNGSAPYAHPHGGAGSVGRSQEEASVDDVVSPIKLDPNDPDFVKKELLALKHEHDVLTRMLADSPLSAADRIAFEKERREGKGEI